MITYPKPNLTTLHRINTTALGLATLLTLGLLLRLHQINNAVWYDEAFSIWLARLPLPNLIAATLGDVHPPAYYLLLNALSHFYPAEASAFWFRLPSLLAGLGLIVVVYRLAAALNMPPAAQWLAAGLVTLSPFQLYYSQEVRSYALFSLLIALAALGLAERRMWLWVVASLAALYVHNMAVLFVVGLWLGALWLLDIGLKKLFITEIIIVLGYLPGVFVIITQAQAMQEGFWVPPIKYPLGRLLMVLDNLLFLTPHSPFGTATALVTALSLVTIGVALPKLLNASGKVLITWGVTPLLLGLLVSWLFQPVMIARTMAPAAPFYCLLLAWSVTSTPRRAAAWLVVTGPVTAVILLSMLFNQIGRPPVDTGYLNLYGHYQAGDAVFHTSMGSFLPWHYYRPNMQYVRTSHGNLVNDLTQQTKTAMGIPQALFKDVACHAPRWWVIQFDNPTSSREELIYTRALIGQYKPTQSHILQDNVTVTARLYLIETAPYCLQ